MKLGVKAKVAIGGVAGLLVLGGAVIWYASQPIVTEESLQAIVRQQTQETSVKALQKPLAQPATAPPSEAAEEMDAAVDEVVDEMMTQLKSLGEETSEPEEATPADVLDEVPQQETEDRTESVPTSDTDEERRQAIADAAMREIPLLVAQWKDVMAQMDALEGTGIPRNPLVYERIRIQHRIIILAMNYHAIRPQEGAIYYPEGKIGRLAKQVGLVFGRTPVSP